MLWFDVSIGAHGDLVDGHLDTSQMGVAGASWDDLEMGETFGLEEPVEDLLQLGWVGTLLGLEVIFKKYI